MTEQALIEAVGEYLDAVEDAKKKRLLYMCRNRPEFAKFGREAELESKENYRLARSRVRESRELLRLEYLASESRLHRAKL